MREWMTAREIADAGLPDLPATESAVIRRAKREAWDSHPAFARRRRGQGGGYEYHFRLLPTLAQVALYQSDVTIDAAAADVPAEAGLQQPSPNLSDRAARERDARLAIVAAFDRFSAGARLRQASCLQVFTDKYNLGSLQVEPWVKDLVPHVSKRSLLRWKAAKSSGVTTTLAVDRGQSRKGTGVLDVAEGGKVRTFILAVLGQNPHFSAAHVRMMCRDEFGKELWAPSRKSEAVQKRVPLPPIRTFQHFIAALKAEHHVVLTKLTNPDLYRSTMAPSGSGTLRHITEPNALWMIDASPIDALCTDGRHTIYACIDIATRRTVWHVSRTPRASAVALLMRKAIMRLGVPRQVKTDNGSDFVANDTERLLISLDIDLDVSEAYSPEQKGFVERVIRTFQHDCATLLPGFIGHSVADRKAIEERKSFAARLGEAEAETFNVQLTGMEFAALIDRWAETIYDRRPHAGLKGKSPFEAFATSDFRPRTVDERALDLLLMPVAGKSGQRITTKFGIRIDGYHYGTPRILPGVPVLVRQDPNDIGKVYAFAQDGGQFLGEGICPELAGVHPATFYKAVRELQAEAISEVTRPVKKLMKELAKGPAPIERALRIAAEDAPNVIMLPKRQEEHSTAQISAALAAMDAIAGTVPPTRLDADTDAEHRRMVAVFHAEESAAAEEAHDRIEQAAAEHEAARPQMVAAELGDNVTVMDTPKARYRRAVDVDRAVLAGTANALDVLWLGQYQTTAEYRGQRAVHEDFGDAYLS